MYRSSLQSSKKIAILLLLIFVFTTFASMPVTKAAVNDNAGQSRFGLGFSNAGPNVTVSDFDYSQMGASWYMDWSYVGGARPGLDYMGLVGGYKKYTPTQISQQCTQVKNRVASNPDKYPHGMAWVVGNEISIDDGRTAADYVAEFPLWKSCLKSIDPTFQVATGAIMSPYWDKSQGKCESAKNITGKSFYETRKILLETEGSGLNIFATILGGLKAKGSGAMPDFVVQHAYTSWCAQFPGWLADRDKFKEVLTLYRSVMNDLGMSNYNLVISEYGLQNWFGYYSEAEVKQYMIDTTAILAKYTDPFMGNPDDGYRMVQKWNWFVMNSWKNWQTDKNAPVDASWWPTVELFDVNTRQLKSVGQTYKDLIKVYITSN